MDHLSNIVGNSKKGRHLLLVIEMQGHRLSTHGMMCTGTSPKWSARKLAESCIAR